jgi:hypothetical protein
LPCLFQTGTRNACSQRTHFSLSLDRNTKANHRACISIEAFDSIKNPHILTGPESRRFK